MLQTQILRSTAMSLWLRKFRTSICSYTGQDGQTITPFGCTEFGWSGVIRLSLSPAERLGSQAQSCLQPRYPAQTVRKPASQCGFPASQHFSVHPNGLINGKWSKQQQYSITVEAFIHSQCQILSIQANWKCGDRLSQKSFVSNSLPITYVPDNSNNFRTCSSDEHRSSQISLSSNLNQYDSQVQLKAHLLQLCKTGMASCHP